MLALMLGGVLVLGAAAYYLLREVPTYIVQIETNQRRITVLTAYSAGRADVIVRKISDAVQGYSGD